MAIGKLAPTMRHARSMKRLASTSRTCQSAGGVLISMRVSGRFFIAYTIATFSTYDAVPNDCLFIESIGYRNTASV